MSSFPPDFESQLDNFLRLAGKKMCANPSAPVFAAWVRQAVPTLLPTLLSQIPDDPEEIRVFFAAAATPCRPCLAA